MVFCPQSTSLWSTDFGLSFPGAASVESRLQKVKWVPSGSAKTATSSHASFAGDEKGARMTPHHLKACICSVGVNSSAQDSTEQRRYPILPHSLEGSSNCLDKAAGTFCKALQSRSGFRNR